MGYDDTAATATHFNFYNMFSVNHSKPMGIFETSATYYPDAPGVSRRKVQRSWWTQLFDRSLHVDKFPLLRLISWFEWAKVEDAQFKDWKVTDDPATVRQLLADLPGDLVIKDYEVG